MKKFKFTISGNNYNVEIKNFDNNIASIEVNGTNYEVEVEQEVQITKTPTIVRSAVSPSKETKPLSSDTKLSQVKAPLPGNILEIKVKEGDTVKKGDNLLIMEAMKMENNVLAEKDGVIKSIKVSAGQAVLQNDVLIDIQ